MLSCAASISTCWLCCSTVHALRGWWYPSDKHTLSSRCTVLARGVALSLNHCPTAHAPKRGFLVDRTDAILVQSCSPQEGTLFLIVCLFAQSACLSTIASCRQSPLPLCGCPSYPIRALTCYEGSCSCTHTFLNPLELPHAGIMPPTQSCSPTGCLPDLLRL